MPLADVPPDVTVEDHVQYYDVEGETLRDIHFALRMAMPVDGRGIRVTGYTRWRVSWSYDWDAACSNPRVAVKVIVGTTLPRWNAPLAAERLVRATWDRLVAAVVRHEEGHRAIAIHAAVDARESIMKRLAAGRCDDPASEARAIVQRYREIETEYDRVTANGRNEGVELR